MINKKICISLGTTAYSAAITQKEITVADLFAELKTPKIRKHKDGRYFIFASFAENTRNAKTLRMYYGATIDLDNTALGPDDFFYALSHYTYFVYTTFNHGIKGDRYRLVLPYKFPLTPERHVDAVLYLSNLLGKGEVDLSTKTLSLPAYLPACPASHEHLFTWEENITNDFFNIDHPEIQRMLPEIRLQRFDDSNNTRLDLNKEIPEGERNSTLARIVGKFLHQGVSQQDVLNMALAFNDTKINPPLEAHEVETIVNSVIQTHSRNHGGQLWGVDEVLSRMADAQTAKNEFKNLCRIIAYGKLHNKFSVPEMEMMLNELRKKTGVTKKTINEEISAASIGIQAQDENLAEEIVEEQSEGIRERFQHWVYIASDDRVYSTSTGEFYKREAFNIMFYSSEFKSNIFNVLIKYNLLNKASRLEFDPERPVIYQREGITYANAYIEPKILPRQGDVSPMLDHFAYLFPDEYYREILLNFFAYMVQFPGKKIRWMPIIKGKKGIGKSILAEKIVRNVIGFANIGKVTNSLIRSDFNAWQLNKQLVVFEELNVGDTQKEKAAFTESLKSFITDDMMKAHRKGIDPYDVENKVCCIGFTNAEEPVLVTVDERRFCFMVTHADPRSEGYYAQFSRWCEQHGPEMMDYFLNKDLTGFTPGVSPWSEFTDQLKALSLAWPASILWQLTNNQLDGLQDVKCISYEQIVKLIKNNSVGKYRLMADELNSAGTQSQRILQLALRQMGFVLYERKGLKDSRIRHKRARVAVWIPEKFKEEVSFYNAQDVIDYLDSLPIREFA
jgi:hypothetical protein